MPLKLLWILSKKHTKWVYYLTLMEKETGRIFCKVKVLLRLHNKKNTINKLKKFKSQKLKERNNLKNKFKDLLGLLQILKNNKLYFLHKKFQ